MGLQSILAAVSIAQDNLPRYKFIIYNASIVFWTCARPLLRTGCGKYVVEYYMKMIEALEKNIEENKVWKAYYQIALCTAYNDMNIKDKAIGCLKNAQNLVQSLTTPESISLQKDINLMIVIRKE